MERETAVTKAANEGFANESCSAFDLYVQNEAAEQRSRRRLRRAVTIAALCHVPLFLVHLPSEPEALAAPESEKLVFVMRDVRFQPPVPVEQRVPQRRARIVPVPDRTPDDPEPITTDEVEVVVELPETFDLGNVAIPEPPVRDAGPILWTPDIEKPVRIAGPMPRYTELARKVRLTGAVIVQAVIQADGTVSEIEVLKPLDFGLEESAVEAVSQWRFAPARLNGEPVAVIYTLTVRFDLQ